FRMLINNSSNTEVIFWHSFPFAGNTKREYCGVILRQEKEINGSVIYPALSLSPTLLNDEKRKWLTEYTTRQNTTMSLRRVTLRPGLAGNLITGQILPVSLFNTSLLPW
ncbi:conjugal transfer protein TraE, partial [Salmonella enterica]|nr:conjugal transfer protein TraE [Salmonella enterica]